MEPSERLIVLETRLKMLEERQSEDRADTKSITGKMDALSGKIDDLVTKVYRTLGVVSIIQMIVIGAVLAALRGAI